MADSTLSLLLRGYAWLPDRRRRSGGAPVRSRLVGKRVIALHGPAAVRFFYDENHIHRHGTLPEPVIDTLFGQGAVHTLDGEPHRVRKGTAMVDGFASAGPRQLRARVARRRQERRLAGLVERERDGGDRFYPFAPFIGGLAANRLEWEGGTIRPGTLVLLDLYGQNHDPDLWPRVFDPARFQGTPVRPDELVPQGGGDPTTGHRCPGEDITVALLSTLAVLLSGLAYRVPEQDLSIPLHRVPTAPRSGFVIEDVR
ncbi:cytochrome P450 [Streptomyces sp. NPDC048567]|uniref:cytochrome P450 n=1 Tax=Streptomyces sp. NPDC048567 TaxID=3365570 RepID=UPI0037112AD3